MDLGAVSAGVVGDNRSGATDAASAATVALRPDPSQVLRSLGGLRLLFRCWRPAALAPPAFRP